MILASQVPPVPPDETPGLREIRPLSVDEDEQLTSDLDLLRSLTHNAPYARAMAAFHRAEDLAATGALTSEGRPTARTAASLRRALEALASSLDELDGLLAASLPAAPTQLFTEQVAALRGDPDFRLSIRAGSLPTTELRVVRSRGLEEFVVAADDAVSWSVAAGVDSLTGPVGVLTIVARGLGGAARLTATWLLEQRESADNACRRLSALSGEAFRGPAFVVGSSDEGDLSTSADLRRLPIEEVYLAQFALRRAERLLVADDDGPPALRGPDGLTMEALQAIVASPSGSAEAGPTDEVAQPSEAHRPLDLEALIQHLFLGAIRLEQAWSRALSADDVATLTGEWMSLVRALEAHFEHDDQSLDETERELLLPPDMAELSSLLADDARPDRRRRTAQAMVAGDLIACLGSMTSPTNAIADHDGRSERWFSSGAFANVRHILTLLHALLAADGEHESAAQWLNMAINAGLRGDPVAELVHLARVLREMPGDSRVDADTQIQELRHRVYDLASRTAAGEKLHLEQVTVGVLAARELLSASSAPQ